MREVDLAGGWFVRWHGNLALSATLCGPNGQRIGMGGVEADAFVDAITGRINRLSDALAPAPAAAAVAAPDVKAARIGLEMVEEFSRLISKAEYDHEEAGRKDAWNDVAQTMRDGTMASYRLSFEQIAVATPPQGAGVDLAGVTIPTHQACIVLACLRDDLLPGQQQAVAAFREATRVKLQREMSGEPISSDAEKLGEDEWPELAKTAALAIALADCGFDCGRHFQTSESHYDKLSDDAASAIDALLSEVKRLLVPRDAAIASRTAGAGTRGAVSAVFGPVRHMDEIDAARPAGEWLDSVALALPRIPNEQITIERADAGVRVYWRENKPYAVMLTIRDGLNFTFGMGFDLSRIAAEERASPADGTTGREGE